MKKIYLSLLLIAASISGFSQDHMLYALGDNPQLNMVNPAIMPKSSFMSIPIIGGLGFNMGTSLNYNSFLKNGYIDGTKLASKTSKNNPLRMGMNLDIMNFGIRFKDNQMITASIRARVVGGTNYPSDIFKMLFDNPISYTGGFDVPLQANFVGWAEVGVGYTREINSEWSVGGKIKFLDGMGMLNTKKTQFDISKTVSQYTIKGDVEIENANVLMFDNANGNTYNRNFVNPGMAVDLGVQYTEPGRKWSVGLSITDLGFISWSPEASSRIVSKNPNAVYNFKGLGELESVFASSSIGDLLDATYDDMLDAIELDTLSGAGITRMTPVTFNLGGNYNFNNNKHTVSLSMQGIISPKQQLDYNLTAGYRYTIPSGKFSVLGTLSNKRTDPIALGVGIMAQSRGFQFYALTDFSLLAIGGAQNFQSAGLKLGLNVFFNKRNSGNTNNNSQKYYY